VLYDAYGKQTLYNAAWSSTQASTLYTNEVLYAGYRLDPESGLYQVRHRHYHPTLGRWVQRDPIGYHDGQSLYEYVGSAPTWGLDPTGLQEDPLGRAPRARPITKESGEEQLRSLVEGLKGLCEKCNDCPECTEAQCKEEAEKISKALWKTWNANFGKGASTGDDQIGGYLCWDWARVFQKALANLELKCWKSELKTYAMKVGGVGIHTTIRISAGKGQKKECTKVVDGGNLGGKDVVHDGGFPAEAHWESKDGLLPEKSDWFSGWTTPIPIPIPWMSSSEIERRQKLKQAQDDLNRKPDGAGNPDRR
jgi:RHS repeat-associated protein